MAEPEETFIEDQLAKMANVVCLPYAVQVTIPSSCFKKCPDAVGRIRQAMHRTFGGTTSHEGVGTWSDDDTGEDVIEPVTVIESSHSCTDPGALGRFEREVGDAARAAGQKAVAVKAGRLFILPPRSLIRPRRD